MNILLIESSSKKIEFGYAVNDEIVVLKELDSENNADSLIYMIKKIFDERRIDFKNIDVGEKEGLNCIYTLVSNHDDWDYYETLQWWSVNDYITTNPDDPDNSELLSKTKKAKIEYLLYGRNTIGWAIYVFKR